MRKSPLPTGDKEHCEREACGGRVPIHACGLGERRNLRPRLRSAIYGFTVFFVFLLAFLSAFRTFFPASSVFFASFALAFSVLVFFPTACFAFSLLLFPSFAIAVSSLLIASPWLVVISPSARLGATAVRFSVHAAHATHDHRRTGWRRTPRLPSCVLAVIASTDRALIGCRRSVPVVAQSREVVD